MATAKVTMFGMMTAKPDLFDAVPIPVGMNRETMVNTILLRCADYEVAFPDADFLQLVTNNFFSKYKQTLENWWRAANEEYNPIYNYDRFEEYNRNTKEGSKTSNKGTTTNKVSAYDSTAFQNERQVDDNTDMTFDRTDDNTERNHIFGNIGVTTSSAMVVEFGEIQTKINPYNLIADLYAVETCLLVE